MELNRRDFVKATSVLGAALGVQMPSWVGQDEAQALETADGGVPVLWVQGQSCSGCSVSLLNSITYMTIDELLVNTLDVNFHPTLAAGAGNIAVSAAEKTFRRGGYVLVVEGAIPTGAQGNYCRLWPGLTFQKAVERYAERAAFVLGVGTCACYGGMAAGSPNPTGAQGLADTYGSKRTIKIPGCPTHPDWIVGTVAYLLSQGKAPPLDSYGRPTDFFSATVHSRCPFREAEEANTLGVGGCLEELGCKGPSTRADCPTRRWNSPAKGQVGINWCIGAGAPCFGCTEANFPDGKSPFYRFGGD
jgi:NiFe hydrogenase small subunit HydA